MKGLASIRRHKIKTKLLIIIMLSSFSGLLIVGISLIAYQGHKLKELQKNELKVLSSIIVETTAELLLIEDIESIRNILATLRFREDINKAVIMDAGDLRVALYARNDIYPGDNNRLTKNEYAKNEIVWVEQVVIEGKPIGHLYLVADKSYVETMIVELVYAYLMYMAIGLVVIYLVAINMQKMITLPLTKLKETMRSIIKDKSYEIRAAEEGEDEIGVLANKFNEMLDALYQSNLELKKNENKFRKVIEQSADMFFLVNADGEILDANEASCSVLGYEKSALLKCNWEDIDDHCKSSVVIGSAMKQLNKSESFVVESEFLTKQSSLVPVVINVGLLASINDDLIVVSARDNSDVVRSKKKLKQANDELEAKVNERTIELKRANLELSFAKESAVAASNAKSLFLANMSHEIRTPMNSVIGFTDVLSSSELSEVQRSYVESIRAGSRNLLSLINDILDISKIEAGKMKIKLDSVYIKKLLMDVKEVFSISAREKGLNLTLDIKDDVPDAIITDEVRLRQIVFNLVNNAIKFTRQGEVSIRANIEVSDEDASSIDVVLKVCDSGIGIKKDDQQKIFNMFEQQDGQNTREYGGAGLGLAISKKLAGRLKATLLVESKEGEGSCFTLRMISPKLVKGAQKNIIKHGVEELVLKPVRILVADDVEENRLLIKEYLASQQVDFLFSRDGEEAVDMLRKGNPDIVLMDIRMPKKSGIEAVKEIRADPDINKTPVVAVTASLVDDGVDDQQGSLFDDVILKPIRKEALIKVIGDISGYLEADDGAVPENPLQIELRACSRDAFRELQKFSPVIERAKSRGNFAEIKALLNDMSEISKKYKLPVLEKHIEMIRRSNERFDIEETHDLLSNVVILLSSIQKEQQDVKKT